jgi:regulator of protease activity HflC (stomatin/prohibitin superfamily)
MNLMQKPELWGYKSSAEYRAAENRYNQYVRKMKMNAVVGSAVAGVVGLVALTVLGGSWYTVGEGYRGVALRNGAVVGTAEPGLGFKMPVIDSVVDISVQSNARLFEGVLAYSKDQQTADLTISVNYRLPPDQVETIYAEYGGEEGVISRLLDRQVPQAVKNVFGQYNAVTAIQDRARLVADVQNALMAQVKGPIIIESVQIENIDFSSAYEQSIEARMLAEVEVQKVRQNAEREKVTAEITVIQAQAEADAQLARATAEAEATRIRGEAEASAIKAKAEALKDNAGLIALIQAEKWNGALPTTMIPDSTVPFMDVVK